MKKIATIGAATIFASLPLAGVFAATGTVVTDTVEVSIGSSCTVSSSAASNIYSETMTNSQLFNSDEGEFGKTVMNISCNDAGGWHMTAVGTGADASDKTAMNASGSGTDIATGTATSGATSNWAMKVTGDTATGFTEYKAIPAGATDVASDTASSSEAQISTGYQVWISATQQADTYTGQVTYTLSHPAS